MKSPKYSGKQKRLRFLIVRRVVGQSMSPAVRHGNIVLATGLFKHVKPGQVVILRHGRLEKIKRVKEIKNSRVYVLGDNARFSDDSRVFGWLPIENVIAKIIWPRL